MSIHPDPEKTAEIDAQTAKLRELVKARGPACPETRRRAAAILGATLAGGVASPPPAPLSPPPPPPPSVSRKLAAFALAGLLALAVGCVPVEAIQHCDKQARNAYGLMRAAPSEDGRGVASDELEAWRWQRIMLTGNDAIPPPGVVYPPLPETEAGQ